MRTILLITVAFAVGCGGKPSIGSPATLPVSVLPSKANLKLTQKYKGRDAAYWGKELFDRDGQRSQEALGALQMLGEEGKPFLVEGWFGGAEAGGNDLFNFIDYSDLAPYPDYAVSHLTLFVKQDSVKAVEILGEFGPKARAAIPELKVMLKKYEEMSDGDPEGISRDPAPYREKNERIRKTIRDAIAKIEKR